LLYLADAEELYKTCYPNLISDPQPTGPVFLIRVSEDLMGQVQTFRDRQAPMARRRQAPSPSRILTLVLVRRAGSGQVVGDLCSSGMCSG
jgi:hypothetical protein